MLKPNLYALIASIFIINTISSFAQETTTKPYLKITPTKHAIVPLYRGAPNNKSKTISEGRFVFDTIPLTLEEITNSSDRIFSGICKKIEDIDRDPVSNLRTVQYTFEITESIKGTQKKEITFKQWKPTTEDVGYKVGEKYIIFLHPNSKLGLTSPVGFTQGHFKVLQIGKEEFVKNKLNNIGLTRNIRTQRRLLVKNDEIFNHIHQSSEKGSSINYEDFIKAVRYLVEK